MFYVDFLKQDARNETLRHEMALAHLRVGHIDRWLDTADEATREYEQAIGLFASLEDQPPSRSIVRAAPTLTTGWD